MKVKKGNLTTRQQKLKDIEAGGVGMSKKAMAAAAGYKSKNLSKSYLQASSSLKYQAALEESKAQLRSKIGIPGEWLLRRLIEIGLARPRDVLVLEEGVLKLRDDNDFNVHGGDLAIKSISVKAVDIKTDHRTVVKNEIRVSFTDSKSALIAAIKIGGYFDDSVFNSLEGGDSEVQELWQRFTEQEISANDFSIELAMRGLAVPKAIEIQAKAELAALTKVGTDEGLGDIDLMESYDELLEDRRIEEKKKQVEAERKQELAEREKELETLNQNDDIGTDRITLN
ncbi:MAG: hypothetical protein HN580_09185 [Deltaproteobacteria bacterium]|nr:hypothetical protein [Deltaproteobacteria bacterium]MBT4263988.1 hypothetical protein [Deltaproteobacteria bacterium]MBT4637640.1 hypothetical protein [Deltaproteobacteria bacterium]MBT6502634.1 hypothetical protein [Deltaproteobacteria bacterium]MBT6614036.1 hypothetical protein [Deltaproteobacteria bacterium]